MDGPGAALESRAVEHLVSVLARIVSAVIVESKATALVPDRVLLYASLPTQSPMGYFKASMN